MTHISAQEIKRVGIIGGGPSALFLYKTLIQSGKTNFTIDIFEASATLGCGMPYSHKGANEEHITNVSANEIPELVIPMVDWLRTLPAETLDHYSIRLDDTSAYRVLPRLLFGQYLAAQFGLLLQASAKAGIHTTVHLDTAVTDIADVPDKAIVEVMVHGKAIPFDHIMICTGHKWPLTHEGKVPGYFDSPYPPSKLETTFNHPVAVRGSSLTAIDAIRTLARKHGSFHRSENDKIIFTSNEDVPGFKIILHSINGLLPGIRFHLDDPHLSKTSLLTDEAIRDHIKMNDGFLSLDFIFEKDFKDLFRKKDPAFYEQIKDMRLEDFVDMAMGQREHTEAFYLFKAEYEEAKRSILRKESVHWKEQLAILSFAMNYPAKHFSAEDMLRLQKVLMPLISIIIAFVPQSSCEEMIALHDAGKLELVSVTRDSHVDVDEHNNILYTLADKKGNPVTTVYKTFIDCIGQKHLMLDDFPFKGLIRGKALSAARLVFRDPANVTQHDDKNIEADVHNTWLKVPGIAIDDHFRAIGENGQHNSRIYIMAVPYISGFNPDYSGLDFGEEASRLIVEDLLKEG